jgi:hypothetical protein
LGIICSKVIKYFWKKYNSDEKETYPKIKKEAILSIPVMEIKNRIQKSKHDEIIRLVDILLILKKDITKAKLPRERDRIENHITASENRIDTLVFELYGLNKKDIVIIEKNIQ